MISWPLLISANNAERSNPASPAAPTSKKSITGGGGGQPGGGGGMPDLTAPFPNQKIVN